MHPLIKAVLICWGISGVGIENSVDARFPLQFTMDVTLDSRRGLDTSQERRLDMLSTSNVIRLEEQRVVGGCDGR